MISIYPKEDMKPAVDLSRYNNDWYRKEIGASVFKQFCWYFCNILFLKNRLLPVSGIKVLLLRAFGAQIGKGVLIKPSVNIKYPWKLKIGDYVWIGEAVWIDNLAEVEIGNSVCLSQGAVLLTGNHDYTKINFDLKVSKIKIEDGVWIGAFSLVCPGIVCETSSVLSAYSVASSNLSAYTVYRGNPATVVKERVIE